MRNNKPELLILVGAPGSGKSSFAKYFIRTEHNWARVSRDDFRAMQYESSRASDATEIMITTAIDASIKAYLLKGFSVMIDATHCKMDYIKQYITKYTSMANISFKVFDVPLAELISRCEAREAETGKHIPIKVIEGYVNKLNHLKMIFDFKPIACKEEIFEPLATDQNKQACFLCDLDGTIAEPNGRSMFSPTADEIMNDTPILPAINVLQSLAKNYKIIFVSGRDDSNFVATKQWIEKYVFDTITDEQLLMRKAGDYRRDSVIKKEILHESILPNYNVIGVFDDRLQVIRECWNQERIFCFNVNQYLKEF
jgi:predicted kinase